MTTPAPPEALLVQLGRRNWIILGLLVLGSLLWSDWNVSLGVFCGGMVAILGYRWLERFRRGMLAQPEAGAATRFRFGYVLRLASLGAILYVLIARLQVHPVALAVGLSVVVLNIFYTTLKRLL